MKQYVYDASHTETLRPLAGTCISSADLKRYLSVMKPLINSMALCDFVPNKN